jgi:hypothetical protein
MGFTVDEIEACVLVMRELFLYLKFYHFTLLKKALPSHMSGVILLNSRLV